MQPEKTVKFVTICIVDLPAREAATNQEPSQAFGDANRMNEVEEWARDGTSNSLMKYGMCACCAVMFVLISVYIVAGGLSAGITSNIFVFAPLLVCVGAHLGMRHFMGKSCHGTSRNTDAAAERSLVSIGRKISSE